METVDKRMDKAIKMLKADKKYQTEINALKKIKELLDNGKPARQVELTDEEKEQADMNDAQLQQAQQMLQAAPVISQSAKELAQAQKATGESFR